MAAEYFHNDGPWELPADYQKVAGLLKFTTGDNEQGPGVEAMGYDGRWHSTDQVPLGGVLVGRDIAVRSRRSHGRRPIASLQPVGSLVEKTAGAALYGRIFMPSTTNSISYRISRTRPTRQTATSSSNSSTEPYFGGAVDYETPVASSGK